MRFALVLLSVVVATGATSATAAAPRAVAAPARVTALAMDGRLVALRVGTNPRSIATGCRVWNLTTRAVTTLGRTMPCDEGSTGTGIAAVSIAGSRVLWLHYTGGNIREWRLFTATTTRRARACSPSSPATSTRPLRSSSARATPHGRATSFRMRSTTP